MVNQEKNHPTYVQGAGTRPTGMVQWPMGPPKCFQGRFFNGAKEPLDYRINCDEDYPKKPPPS